MKSNSVVTRVGNAPQDQKPILGGAPGDLGLKISCPVGDSFQVTCGTAADPVPGCGHGGIGYVAVCDPYYYVCVGSRYSDALYHSIDVVVPNKSSSTVKLPYINGETVNWTVVQNTIPIGANAEWGYKMVYQGEYKDKQIRLDLTHLNGDINKSLILKSGNQVGTYTPAIAHLHTAVAIDAQWIEPRKDAGMCAN